MVVKTFGGNGGCTPVEFALVNADDEAHTRIFEEEERLRIRLAEEEEEARKAFLKLALV